MLRVPLQSFIWNFLLQLWCPLLAEKRRHKFCQNPVSKEEKRGGQRWSLKGQLTRFVTPQLCILLFYCSIQMGWYLEKKNASVLLYNCTLYSTLGKYSKYRIHLWGKEKYLDSWGRRKYRLRIVFIYPGARDKSINLFCLYCCFLQKMYCTCQYRQSICPVLVNTNSICTVLVNTNRLCIITVNANSLCTVLF